MLTRKQYKAPRVARELKALLSDAEVARKAEEVGALVRREDGAARASELIEKMLAKDSEPRNEREEPVYASGD